MTAAFNRVMLAGETLFQTGFSLSGGTCYYSRVLDFGCCYSPTIFSQIGNVIVLKIRKEMLRAEQDIVLEPDLKTWVENRQEQFSTWDLTALEFLLQTALFYICMYLDDKTFIAVGIQRILRMRLIVVKIFKELNLELAANKWQLGQCEQILGVGMQLSEGYIFIVPRRLARLKELCLYWLSQEVFDVKSFKSFICMVNFVLKCIPNGAVLLRNSWEIMQAKSRRVDQKIAFSKHVKDDLQQLYLHLGNASVASMAPEMAIEDALKSPKALIFASDGSRSGMGGVYTTGDGTLYIYTYKLAENESENLSMPAIEMLASYGNILLGGPQLPGKRFFTSVSNQENSMFNEIIEVIDCTAVVTSINKANTKSPQMREILKARQALCKRFNMKTYANYYMSKDHLLAKERERTIGNVAIDLADAGSRIYSPLGQDRKIYLSKMKTYEQELHTLLGTTKTTWITNEQIPEEFRALGNLAAGISCESKP